MGIFSRVKDTFFPIMEQFMKGTLDAYCDIETVDGPNLIMKDGSIVTVCSFEGSSRLMGEDDLSEASDTFSEKLSPSLLRAGHAIQVVFTRNPDTTENIVKAVMKGSRYAAGKLSMDLDGLYNEQEDMLKKELVNETCYFFLWTRSSILNKKERKIELEQNKTEIERMLGSLFTNATDIQSLIGKSRVLTQRHDTFVDNFLDDMSRLDLIFNKLDTDEAMNAIINSIYPDRTTDDFRLRGPVSSDHSGSAMDNKKIAESIGGSNRKGHWMRPNAQDDLSFLMWPKVSEQIFISDGKHINANIVRLGNLYAASAAMTRGPQNVRPFKSFVSSMQRMPYRVCFTIEGDGLSGMRTKEVLASICRITNKADNGPIATEINQMKAIQDRGNTLDSTIIRIRINFSTWCNISDGLEEIEKRSNFLVGGITRWGNSQASSASGDPMGGVLSTVGGLTINSTAPAGAAPLPEISFMLPWQRETSPWESGWPFKTDDDRIFPYLLGSSKQDTFADVIYATPGRGKSVLLNTLNFSFCLSEQNIAGGGTPTLPLCRIIDIGFSSEGLVTLLRSALPESRRYEAVHMRMTMQPDQSAVNIFDTPLGCRYPIKYDKEFQVRMLSIFMSEGDNPPRFSDAIISQAIDVLYKQFSDKERINSKPKRYKKGTNFEVDEAMSKYGLVAYDSETTWWEIVDMLYHKYGDARMAGIAQKYAVPLLEDIPSLDFTEIDNTYGEAQSDDMSVIEIFRMAISSVIRDYPILNEATTLDLQSARVVALDIQQVCGDDSAQGRRQTSIMYMLARFITTKGFFYGPGDIGMFDKAYRKYHEPILYRNQASAKRIIYDEFHKTGGSPGVRAQVVKDMREGRKWKVQISLASQMLDDFGDEILGLASSTFLLGVNNVDDERQAIERFNLSNMAGSILHRDLKGATKKGGPMLALVNIKGGAVQEHFLYNKLSPQYIWAFTTTREDADLRNLLYDKIGVRDALRVLGLKFRGGSAKEAITEMNRRHAQENGMDIEASHKVDDGIIETIANELIKESIMLNK